MILDIIGLIFILLIDLVFYKMGIRAFVFITSFFGFFFSLFTIGDADVPFDPFFQLFLCFIFIMIIIWGRKLK